MEILPNLQLIIVASLITSSLFVATALLFYKLGKREKEDKRKINNIEKQETAAEVISPSEIPKENGHIATEANHVNNEKELLIIRNGKDKKINATELYAKKIEEEIKNIEEENSIKNNKTTDYKFLKYTSKGYKPAKGDKEPGALRWR